MIQQRFATDPAAGRRAILDEADIGSGEKTPGQLETEEMIREIPPLPPGDGDAHEAPPAAQQDRQRVAG